MLAQIQKNLRDCRADVRWVAVPSIHLTLKFLGEVDPALLPALGESLEAGAGPEHAFDLRIHGLGCFPNLHNPRVIWCGIDTGRDSLFRLQKKVEDACRAFGFGPEDRPFHPHLTLGRVNGKRNLQPLLDCIKMGSDLECSFRANHFNIYRSILKPQGAEYSVLKSIALDA